MRKLTYIPPRQYKHLSRYSIYNQIADSLNGSTYLESVNPINLNSENRVFHVVETSEENRLDIISKKYYGTPTLYWAIAMANNIIDPTVVFVGTILEIPSYESLYDIGGPLVRRE